MSKYFFMSQIDRTASTNKKTITIFYALIHQLYLKTDGFHSAALAIITESAPESFQKLRIPSYRVCKPKN